jgi:hypothetical protein
MSENMTMTSETEQLRLISRREAIRHVSALLGGVTFIGGNRLLAAVVDVSHPVERSGGLFTAADIAFLDEIAETILPETKTPGAKAAKTGAFMALMVTDSYWPAEQKVFREGMRKIDEAMKKAKNVSFMQATPAQRLALLTALDREQLRVMDARDAAERREKGLAPRPAAASVPTTDQKLPVDPNENLPVSGVTAPGEMPKKAAHYFRMMKELAMLGYFTSKIGYTKVMRYAEVPGRFDPCLPYTPGEPAWADHA